MTPVLLNIDHIHVYVVDRARAEVWYREVLGLSRVKALEFWAPDAGPLTLGNAGGTIHLALFERPAQVCRSTIAFAASAVEFLAWKTHLSEILGKPISVSDHSLSWSLYFSDPDGNPYEITSYDYATLAAQLK
jgi:catechol-2,3-dioxygenase